MGFWLQLGVSGFRMDAVPFLIEKKGAGVTPRKDYELLHEMRDFLPWRRGDAILLAEANVPPERPRLLRRRRPAPDDAQLLGEPAPVPGAGHRRHPAAGAGDGGHLPPPEAAPVGQLPAQPRRARPRPAHAGGARARLRGVRAGQGHAALRPRHPPPAGTDARQRSPASRAGVQPAVHAAGNADAAVRRRDRHRRRPDAAGARERADAHAVVV